MAASGVQENVIHHKSRTITMKAIVVAVLSLMLVNNTWAQSQQKNPELSSYQAFSSKSGTLLRKEFIEIGHLKSVEVQVLRVTDLVANESASAIRLRYDTGSGYSSVKITSLDADEIEGLKSSIKLMQGKVLRSVPTNYVEMSFNSRSGFEAGCFWSKQKWTSYIQLDDGDRDSMILLKEAELTKFIALLDKAQILIKE